MYKILVIWKDYFRNYLWKSVMLNIMLDLEIQNYLHLLLQKLMRQNQTNDGQHFQYVHP